MINTTSTARERPSHLPDFAKPPLAEVVLGVQFSPPAGYQQIRAGEVWSLYREQYPIVQEHPALQPTFETFGLPQQIGQQLSFVSSAMHDRFWFVRQDGAELIQFQQDRLLHNWRKVNSRNSAYPRFERMAESFQAELIALEKYLGSIAPQKLAITQCEVSYVNHINIGSTPARISDWLNGISFDGIMIDDCSIVFREIVLDEVGHQVGRLTYEVATAVKADGQRQLRFILTVRVRPALS